MGLTWSLNRSLPLWVLPGERHQVPLPTCLCRLFNSSRAHARSWSATSPALPSHSPQVLPCPIHSRQPRLVLYQAPSPRNQSTSETCLVPPSTGLPTSRHCLVQALVSSIISLKKYVSGGLLCTRPCSRCWDTVGKPRETKFCLSLAGRRVGVKNKS